VLRAESDSLEVKVIDDGSGIKKQPAKPDIDRKMHGEEDARAWACSSFRLSLTKPSG